MSVLTKNEILKRIEKGDLKIEPFDEKSIGPASIDFHLGDAFRVFKTENGLYHIDKNANHEDITEPVEIDEYIVIEPKQTIHGITVEKLTLPDDLCAWIEGRSMIGRLGLTTHITAGFIQPGVSNKTVLEIHNMGPLPLALHPGIAICQIILMETKGKARYEGKFQTQEKP